MCVLTLLLPLLSTQTARAAALLQRLAASGQGSGTPPEVSPATQMAQNPTWPSAAAPNPLLIPEQAGGFNPLSPTGSGLNPASFPGAAGFNPLGVGSFGVPGGLGIGEGVLSSGSFNLGPQAGMQLNNPVAGIESSQSSAANNLQSGSEGAAGGLSGSGFAGLGPAAGAALASLTSPEAVYGTDGLDVPGTAQVGSGCLSNSISKVMILDCNMP